MMGIKWSSKKKKVSNKELGVGITLRVLVSGLVSSFFKQYKTEQSYLLQQTAESNTTELFRGTWGVKTVNRSLMWQHNKCTLSKSTEHSLEVKVNLSLQLLTLNIRVRVINLKQARMSSDKDWDKWDRDAELSILLTFSLTQSKIKRNYLFPLHLYSEFTKPLITNKYRWENIESFWLVIGDRPPQVP